MTDPAPPDPVLAGRRVRLRPWREDDLPDVLAACQDPAIGRWTTVPSPYGPADARSFLDDHVPGARAAGGVALAIEDTHDPDRPDRAVGSIAMLSLRDGTGELGYWVAAPARGRGLAGDALDTLVRWLFARPHAPAARLELLVEPDNAASRAVAAAAGFLEEGTLRSRLLLDGVRRDVVVYSRLPGDPGPAGFTGRP